MHVQWWCHESRKVVGAKLWERFLSASFAVVTNPKFQWLTTEICFSFVLHVSGCGSAAMALFHVFLFSSETLAEGADPTRGTKFLKEKDRQKQPMAFEASAAGKICGMSIHISLAKISHMAKPNINRAKNTPRTQEALKITLQWMQSIIFSEQGGLNMWCP